MMRSNVVSLESSRPGRIVAPLSDDEDEDFIPVAKTVNVSNNRRWTQPDSPQYDDDIEVASVVDVDMESGRKSSPPPGIPTEPLPSLAQAISSFKLRVGAKKAELAAREEQAEAERHEMERLRLELAAIKGEVEAARQRVRTLETAVYEQEIAPAG